MRFPSRRLFWPLIVSLTLHAAIGTVVVFNSSPQMASRIEVQLPRMAEAPLDQLLKNTYHDAGKNKPVEIAAAAPHGNRVTPVRELQQRLSDHVFYPPQAVEQGLEGEVRLLLRLDSQGRLLEARVASSSGHELLDQAAVAAAYATGAFGGGNSELILPVVFRLSE